MNSHSLNLHRDYSNSFTLWNARELSRSWIPKNHIQVQKEIENSILACLRPPLKVKLGCLTPKSRSSDGKEMYKKAWCTCRVVVLLFKSTAFLTFSFLSLSMDLKLPIIWEEEYVTIFVNNRKWLSKRYLSRNPLKMWTNVWPIISITCGKKRQ